MLDLNVGDVFKRNVTKYPQWEVTAVRGREVKVTLLIDSTGMACKVNQGYHHISSEGFTIVTPANPNLITVSSLDYMSSTTLTDEDKLIIMEHLEHA